MENRSAQLPRFLWAWISMILLLFCACRNNAASSNPHDKAEKPGAVKQEPRRGEVVRFTEAQIREFGISTAPATAGIIRIEVELPGEVVLNADRIAHVVPRVSGVVKEVRINLGDTVRRGEVMAVLESRELADSAAALIAARARVALAQTNYAREEQVWKKRLSPEQDYLEAKTKLAETTIELHTAEQKLRSLGFSNESIAQLPGRSDEGASLYAMTAPFEGTVMEKHISLGEVLNDASTAFVIADLSTVWVNLDIQQKDLPLVKVGQTAAIGFSNESARIQGRIGFLEPTATETNRTIHARIVVPNAAGTLRPGSFVTGRIPVETVPVPILVPNTALVMVDGKTGLFVKEKEGFRLQSVSVGRTDGKNTEIKEGLSRGQVYVDAGAFTVKSELEKPEAEE
jgi:membrane fusion protein, heavy metal efflux system